MVFFAAGGDHLVHNAALAADKLILCLLANQGQLLQADIQSGHAGQSQAGDHFQTGRGAQASALRHVADDGDVHALEVHAFFQQNRSYTTHVVAPERLFAVSNWQAQFKFRYLAVKAVRGGNNFLVISWRYSNHGLVINSAGQHEAVVVVGVLTDQVDPAGGLEKVRWLVAERVGEQVGQCLFLAHQSFRFSFVRDSECLAVRAAWQRPAQR